MNYRIELRNIGRGKANENILTSQPTLSDAESRALDASKKYIGSINVDLGFDDNGGYNVYAGFHCAGKVKIIPINKKGELIS